MQGKSVGLLEARQSNIPPLRRLQSVEFKASESAMTVTEFMEACIHVLLHITSLSVFQPDE